MLSKKLYREVWYNKSQFLTVFLIVFIGVLVFSGIHAYMDGMDKYSNEFYENNNLQDLWMTGENFTQDELDSITQKYGKNTTETLGIEIKNGDTKKTNSITINDSNDKVRVCDHKFNYIKLKDNGIYITEKLAKILGVSVGDKIEWHIL